MARGLVSLVLLILTPLYHARIARKINSLTKESDCVIWDAAMATKEYMDPLLSLFRDTPSYSIKHGIGLHSNPNQSKKAAETDVFRRITAFAMTLADIDEYKRSTGVSAEKIQATGIYRHHPEWIETLTSRESKNVNAKKGDCLLVVSRGYSPPNRYLPRDRLISYLEDIKTAAENLDLGIIVKPHPKEVDLSVYPEAFGSVTTGVNWEISDLHLAILAKRTQFAVSFYSGSCLDLTAYGVPTIERLNLDGLSRYVTPSETTDSTGTVFEYRENGHVLGSSTSKEFFLRVDEVMSDREQVLEGLRKAYSRVFITPPTSPRELAQRISDSCFGVSEG